jgi:hypothetical protein
MAGFAADFGASLGLAAVVAGFSAFDGGSDGFGADSDFFSASRDFLPWCRTVCFSLSAATAAIKPTPVRVGPV